MDQNHDSMEILLREINGDQSLKAIVLESNRQLLIMGHLKWYRIAHVMMLGLWGLWVVLFRPFAISPSYDVMKAWGIGPFQGELFIGPCAIFISMIAHQLLSPNRRRLMVVALIFSVVFGFICGLFLMAQPRSTAVFMYGFIGVIHFAAFVDLFRNLAPGRFNSIKI